MRTFLLLAGCAAALACRAGECHLSIDAKSYAGRPVALQLYDDLVTLRTITLARGAVDRQGHVRLSADVRSITKAVLRIGDVSADLFLVPGASYQLEIPAPDPRQAMSIAGTARVDPLFRDLDPMDVNALIGDLNERLDAFVAADLATDESGGMKAAGEIRDTPRDQRTAPTGERPPTLFVNPAIDAARIDTFERKLRKFYAEVKEPFFQHELEYGIAGLRVGPNASGKSLWEGYVKGKEIRYDSPEQIRFLRNFFGDHLMAHPFRSHEKALTSFVREGRVDSLKALLARHEFLRNDDRLCELVLITGLYDQYYGKVFDRSGILKVLDQVAGTSTHLEHRAIALNMHWDLTTMRQGSVFPILSLTTSAGRADLLDTLPEGVTCIAVTASWCIWCELEMAALENLYKEYGGAVNFIGISLDSTRQDLVRYLKRHPARDWTWYHASDQPVLMEELRMRAIPAFFLLNGRTLAQVPAPLPSQGMAAVLHRVKTEAEERNKIKFGNDAPPPRRQ